ncbi:MAG: bifunctional folylpolyglutamate synthase/dihydrofolate synthase [Desulfofustis sp.]|nr:bifunctional folylpolyglutamate synthase/dihydrofolate synthase [Desulfofustis sp.]
MNTPIATYRDACTYLDDLQMHKIKLGLDAMQSTLAPLGSPETACPAVHVAGTNGKGSVCSMLRSVATRAGYKTGLYTSPHLDSVRERFRIDGDYISREAFTRLMETIRISLGSRRITYFECATALAFLWFAENGCDLVVLETGMGGRLDATNVVTPLLSIITTVSLDHEQYLGTTVEQVAFEKAGIIKPGVPVLSGVGDPAAQAVIERACSERGAPLMLRGRDFGLSRDSGTGWRWTSSTDTVVLTTLPDHLPNLWQVDNISCAVAAAVSLRRLGFPIDDPAIDQGVGSARWPGRMELIDTGHRYLLDGAHNPAGIDYLIQSLAHYRYNKLIVIWASMGDKSYGGMLNALAAVADVLLLTRPHSERAAQLRDLYGQLRDTEGKSIGICSSPAEARIEAEHQAGPGDLIVVAGSLYLVGEFRELLVGKVTGDG